MRFLHVSDLHVGKRVNEFPMLEDQRVVLDQVVSMVAEHGADAVVVAGDVYDKATPSAEAVSLVDEFLTKAAASGVPVIVTAGNHDSAERVAYGHDLLAERGVFVSPVYDGTIEHVTLRDEHGPVTFWLVPFLKPAMVRAAFPGEKVDSYTDALRVALSACRLDPAQRNVAVAHQWVTYGSSKPEASDSETSVGGLDDVDGHVFDAFDYVALGHVHRPQRIGRHSMRYCGSPLKYSFSEIPFAKSVPVVDLGPKSAGDEPGACVTLELAPLVPPHDMREMRHAFDEMTSPEALAEGDPQDYLRVVLTDEEPPADALARLRATYPNIMALEVDNARTRATAKLPEALAAQAKARPLELFAQFYEAANGAPLDEERAAAVRRELQDEERGAM